MPSRRAVLSWTLGSLALLLPSPALASIARGLSLSELRRGSGCCVLGTALSAQSRWETVGRNRRIVTTTRLRVEQLLGGAAPGTEALVRTLGGQVGDVGQIVHGEALLLLGQTAALFLMPETQGMHAVMGMAQGHFPIATDDRGDERLRRSPRLPELIDADKSASKLLTGRPLRDAERLIQEAFQGAK
jgi:hypothetical protein